MKSLLFTNDEIDGMRLDQDAHMMDTCKVQTRVQTGDTYGELVESWPADGYEIRCGLEMSPGTERHTPDGNVIQYDAIIRLPIETSLQSVDRIKITKRHGERLEVPLVYEVISPLQKGVSGIRYALRRLEV